MPSDPPLVAIVDDEELVRRALARLIRAAGFSVETYSAAPDFLRSLQHKRPHCVVLDLRMPLVSGFDMQEVLRQSGSGPPVIIVTGDDSAEARARALRQGAKAYLRKPVDDTALLEAIQGAIRADGAAGA